MTFSFVIFLMCILTVTTSFALWHTLTALNHMSARTHNGVRTAYILRAFGLFILLLSVFDYLVGEPRTWPWLLLVGAVTATSGSALLLFVTQRACKCGECPVRDALARGLRCSGEACDK